ncbi:short chain dehydrogenase/reductase family oxidoreductase [Aspergillus bombycis]|uniref:Short chain dehydrogenase/reductase family oxidoreductase n=1 Tax=Aspergillus bombycis TaxID=109264 RepID=A0A1F8ABG1_9EURO|nr:short chain dehydrogenase/reductase family oxidoreductase [Aspergillus bombycis]OGM49066.1 short chain dehydrogenase/reductase family oxidoreductase [Aspergillus bombycis]
MASSNKVYVVTGGNRGLGLGLVKSLLARPATTVIASVRNEEAAASLKAETQTVAAGEQSNLYIFQLDFSSAIAPERVIETFNVAAGVDHIDVLICNAGYAAPMAPAASTSAEDLRASFETNTIAPLLVFQGLWPLLQKSAAAPKLINISSSVGSIGGQEPAPGGAYGPSRAAGNWLTRALHAQHPDLIVVALHPGWVQTRAGDFVAQQWGYVPGPPETIDNSVKGMLQVIDGATRETTSGKFITYQGQEVPW